MSQSPSAQVAPRHSSRIRTCGCIAIPFLFLFLLVGAGIFAFLLFQPPAAATAPTVRILTPANGALAPINRPLQVNAIAQGMSNISRIELYADGALVAVEETTLPDGSNPLIFLKEWTPLTTARHALLARAYGRDKQFADSSVVYVDVSQVTTPNVRVNVDTIPRAKGAPLPSLNQIAQAGHMPADRIREANPQLRDVNADAPLPSGSTIQVPPAPAPAPGGSGTPPGGGTPTGSGTDGSRGSPPPPPPPPLPDAPRAATNLAGTGDCASVQLTWSDSPDEERYVIYRLGPGDTRLVPVATLAANTVNYRDTFALVGTYRYQVAAVRGTLEGLTPMFLYTAPGTCAPPPPPTGTSDLLLTWISLETTNAFDSVYCYFSIDGSPFERAPEWPNSLASRSGNARFYDLSQLPGHGMVPLPRHLQSEPVRLAARCLGRRGLTTDVLGTATFDSLPVDWRGTIIDLASPSQFLIRFRIDPDTPEARRRTVPVYLTLNDEALRNLLLHAPTIPEPTNVRYSPNGHEACDQLAEASPFERFVCELTGRPTITWDWSGNNAAIGGFRVEIDSIAGPDRVASTRRSVLVPRDQLARAQARYCGSRLNYSVIVDGTDLAERARNDRNSFDLAPCATGPATVEVTLEDLAVSGTAAHSGRIEDDDTCILCTDDEMELFGSFQVYAGMANHEWDIRAWYGGNNVLQPRAGFFEQLANAIAFLVDLPLRLLDHLLGSCAGYTCVQNPGTTLHWANVPLDTIDESPARNRNTLRVQVPDGASLTIVTDLLDGPTGLSVNNDVYCRQRIELPTRSSRDWSAVDETRSVSQDFGEAACRLTIRVRGTR